jgi:hypothetical protein
MKALLLAGAALAVFLVPKAVVAFLGAREIRRRRRFNPRPLAFGRRARIATPATPTVPGRDLSAEVSHDEEEREG